MFQIGGWVRKASTWCALTAPPVGHIRGNVDGQFHSDLFDGTFMGLGSRASHLSYVFNPMPDGAMLRVRYVF